MLKKLKSNFGQILVMDTQIDTHVHNYIMFDTQSLALNVLQEVSHDQIVSSHWSGNNTWQNMSNGLINYILLKLYLYKWRMYMLINFSGCISLYTPIDSTIVIDPLQLFMMSLWFWEGKTRPSRKRTFSKNNFNNICFIFVPPKTIKTSQKVEN